MISFSLVFLFSKWIFSDDAFSISKKNMSLKLTKSVSDPSREPSSTKVKPLLKVKKKLLPPKPIVLYVNEQRNLRRKIDKNSRINKKTFQGSDVSTHNSKYKILDGFFAIVATPENKLKYPDAQEKLNHLIIESEEIPSGAFKVTQNADNGSIGIMTGIIKVKLIDFSLYNQLFEHNNYFVESTYDYINLVHYKFSDIDLALKENENLKSHSNVKRVSLEILEFSRHSR
jgi:hypothetical protein